MKKFLTTFLLALCFFSFGFEVNAKSKNTEEKSQAEVIEVKDSNTAAANNEANKCIAGEPGCPGKTGDTEKAAATPDSSKPLESKIDLFAPFASQGDDIQCRFPKYLGKADSDENCTNDKAADGPFDYCTMKVEDCLADGGQPVQRITTEAKAESILGAYISMVIVYAMGVGAGFAVLMIIVGGVQIIASSDDQGALDKGKERIVQGILGIAILLLSALILYTINPLFFVIT